MITTPKMYGLQCDNCKEDFENFVGFGCTNESDAFVSDAIESGWHKKDADTHYCEECHHIDNQDNLLIDLTRKK